MSNIRGIMRFELHQQFTRKTIVSLLERIVPKCQCSKCRALITLKEWHQEICDAFGFDLSDIPLIPIGKHDLVHNRRGKTYGR